MLKNFLNKRLYDIITIGYSEKDGDLYVYSPMLWWLYLKTEDEYIILRSNGGTINVSQTKKIECKFDIEEDDLFTISSILKDDFGNINAFDLFYDHGDNLIGFGINMKEDKRYIHIDSLNIHGFAVEIFNQRETALNNFDFSRLDSVDQ